MEPIDFLNYAFKPDWAAMWENGIKTAWADDMVRRHGSIIASWDNHAREYDNGEIKHSNRADLVEKLIAPQPETVLDVGGGTGVFAIPLAKKVKKVVVVEPSAGMLEVLEEKAQAQGLENISLIQKKWEDVSMDEVLEHTDGALYDAVLSSHSLYYIQDLQRSFLKMDQLSKGYVYLFTGCTGRRHDPHYEKLYLILHKKPLPPYPDYASLYMVLREIGIQPNIEMIQAKAKIPVKDLDELVDKWRSYITEPLSEEQEEAIRAYLSKKVKKEGDQLFQRYEYKNALIFWKPEDRQKGENESMG